MGGTSTGRKMVYETQNSWYIAETTLQVAANVTLLGPVGFNLDRTTTTTTTTSLQKTLKTSFDSGLPQSRTVYCFLSTESCVHYLRHKPSETRSAICDRLTKN